MRKVRVVGFEGPNNRLEYMGYGDVLDYCKELCEREENMEEFQKFQRKYQYFEPYFDFVTFHLKHLFLNPLLEDKKYLVYNKKALYPVLIKDYDEDFPNYIEAYSNNADSIFATFAASSDYGLQIENFEILNRKFGMIDPNGMIFTSRDDGQKEGEGSHETTADTVLNQILISCPKIRKHYTNLEEHQSSGNYLVKYLGFIRYSVFDNKLMFVRNEELLTPILQSTIELAREYKLLFDQKTNELIIKKDEGNNNNYDIQKDLIKEYCDTRMNYVNNRGKSR